VATHEASSGLPRPTLAYQVEALYAAGRAAPTRSETRNHRLGSDFKGDAAANWLVGDDAGSKAGTFWYVGNIRSPLARPESQFVGRTHVRYSAGKRKKATRRLVGGDPRFFKTGAKVGRRRPFARALRSRRCARSSSRLRARGEVGRCHRKV